MQNSQLILVLSSLSKKENRELRKWLVSPIHNQRSDVVQLYEYLTSGNRLEDDKSLEKERIYRKLYPKEAYDDARMRQVIHFLQESTEAYLAYTKSTEDIVQQKLALAKNYREKKLTKLYQKTIKSIEDIHSTKQKKDDDYLEKSFLIEREKSEQASEGARTANFQEMSDSAELAFIARKLKLACGMISYQRIFKAEYDFGMIDQILNYIDNKKHLLEIPIIKVYYDIYRLFKYPQHEQNFFEVKNDILVFESQFLTSEKLDIFMAALNYCIGKMNTGHSQYIREAFEIYQRGLESEVFTQGGTISPHNFRNIVTTGTSLKEFEWVSSFIKNYENYLAPEYRENFVQFSLAKLYFEKGDYDKAQRLLIQFDIDDVLINLSAKSMLIKMYFEEGEINTLESLLESLRTYINRKKSIAYHKIIYNNLIRFTKKLVRLPPRNKALKERLRKQIEDANPLPERKWLLEQLDKI